FLLLIIGICCNSTGNTHPVSQLIVQLKITQETASAIILIVFVTSPIWVVPINWAGARSGRARVPSNISLGAVVDVPLFLNIYVGLPPLLKATDDVVAIPS